MDNLTYFREALRDNRKQRNLTLAQVSLGMGVTIGYLSDIERGNREPSEDLALRLCELYQIDPDFYFACVGRVPVDIRQKAPTILMDSFAQLRSVIKDKGW